MRSLFWISAFLAAYPYVGYPLVLFTLRRLAPRPVRKAPSEPSVSLLIAAYNEADVIAAKLTNSLALDYPDDRLEIVVTSDGSTDATCEIARGFLHDRRVRLIDFPQNRGKLLAMNDAVTQVTGDVIVFSDASSMLEPGAVRALVSNLSDPAVGAVSGSYLVRNPGQSALGGQEDLYWRYETALKTAEADLDSTLGAHGALYGIRRELYPFPEKGVINDDFVIPMRIVARGYRAVYEPAAVAVEEAHEMEGFRRRVRIMAGNIQQLRELPRLLSPLRALPVFFFLSHKVMRLLVPPAMLVCLLANALLLGAGPFYRAAFVAQLVFYALALSGALFALQPRVLRLPYYFSMINFALFVALFENVLRRRRIAWQTEGTPTGRP